MLRLAVTALYRKIMDTKSYKNNTTYFQISTGILVLHFAEAQISASVVVMT